MSMGGEYLRKNIWICGKDEEGKEVEETGMSAGWYTFHFLLSENLVMSMGGECL